MSVSGTTVNVVYDAFGNRVAKTVNGVTTKYLAEDDVNPTGYSQVWDELTGSTVTRTYTYGLQRISQDQAVDGARTPRFYGYDGAGSVRQLTNSAGTVTDTYEYDAFGNEVNHAGTTPNNYLYRGEQYDADLVLYDLRARYFNPATGSFLSRDPEDGIPTDPATLHKYIYAGGDPVNFVDPTGRATGQATVAGGDTGEYGGLATLVLQVVQSASVAVAAADTCALLKEASESLAYNQIGLAGNGDQGTIEQVNPCWVKAKVPKCGTGEDNHHMLPQQFRKRFSECGIGDLDASEYTKCVPRKCHWEIHSNQDGPGTNWNARWNQFLGPPGTECPAGGVQGIESFMQQLAQQFEEQFNCLE
jgi:RHS repeat-associated protein